MKDKKDDAQSNGLAMGMCLGLCIGTAIGVATNNIGLWMPIGLCLGMCLGAALGSSNKKNGSKDDISEEDFRDGGYKHTDFDVRTYDLDFLKNYRFVVIFARYRGKWLYCRHKERTTWETAGGHIEEGETALEAAKRELHEETGATKFDIRPLFDFSVHTPTVSSNGQVYLADITELSGIPDSKISEVALFDTYPKELTYPHILPTLFEKVNQC